MLSTTTPTVKVTVQSKYEDYVPEFYRSIPIEGDISCLTDDMALWQAANPVFLDLPTGEGKTTFVYNVLLPEALKQGKNLLLVSNRVALSTQQKRAVMKLTNAPQLKLLTDEGVRQTEDFCQVRVVTYHRLPALLHDKAASGWIANLAFVVFDEAHFFTSDSIFNENVDYILRLACERFCHAIRFYLSGTSWDVLEPLAEAEQKYYHSHVYQPCYQWPPVREIIRYTKTPDFSPYSLHFFHSLSELVPKIQEDHSDKWIVFTDSKARGKEFASSLKGNCVYLDAESKGSQAWCEIIERKCFEKQVLVTTSALDNGIDIEDPAVKNVAVVTDNRTSLIQMMGRKRLKGGEHVDLWVCDLAATTISNRYQWYCHYLEWYSLYDEYAAGKFYMAFVKKIWNEADPVLLKLFRFADGRVYCNELARHVMERRRWFFFKILSGETTFKTEVENWLGIKSDDVPSAELLRLFYQKCGERPLTDSEQAELLEIVLKCYIEAGFREAQPSRKDKISAKALSNRLVDEKLPYAVRRCENDLILYKTEERRDEKDC